MAPSRILFTLLRTPSPIRTQCNVRIGTTWKFELCHLNKTSIPLQEPSRWAPARPDASSTLSSQDVKGWKPLTLIVASIPLCSTLSATWTFRNISFCPETQELWLPGTQQQMTGTAVATEASSNPLGVSSPRPVSLYVDWTLTKPCMYLCEVPALDEVTGHITSRLPVDHTANVMPWHPGGGVPVNEICPGVPGKNHHSLLCQGQKP